MRHTEIALRRPITTIMTFVALALLGFLSSRLLPLEQFPDIDFPGIFIQIPYPGSTPEEVERRITRPIEEALATLSGVERMRSTSQEDQAEIGVFFGWDQEAGVKGIEARAKIDAIRNELPDDLQRILIFTGSTSDQPVLVLRISADRDLSDAYDMLDRNLKRRIERLEGVSRVTLEGVEPREIRILLDVDRVAAHNINIAELRSLLEKSNFAVSAGLITDHGRRFSVRPIGEFKSLADIENIIIDRGSLRLRDVASVEMRAPERNYGRHLNGTYAIGVHVLKQTGANIVDVVDRAMAEVEKVRELPEMQGINIFTLDNQGASVRDSLSDLLRAGLIGALLAIGVLYLFMRQITTTLIVTLAVPFSLLITLGMMYFFDLSLNILTMMGLMLAVGMLVDNSVVVTENIFRHRKMHPDKPFEATLLGVNEVSLAVIAGTATSIIVFVPIMFGAQNNITIFLTHVAITVTVAMLASLVLAQTLIPMLASRLPPPTDAQRARWMERLTEWYTRALSWTLRRKWWTALGIFLIVASIMIPANLINFNMWPQEGSRRLFLPYNIQGHHTLEIVEETVNRIEGYLFANKEDLEVTDVYSYFEPDRAESTILLTNESVAKRSTTEIIEQIQEELPEIIIGEPSFDFDFQGGAEGFSLQISGESTEHLAEISDELIRLLRTVDGLENVRSEGRVGEQEIRVVVDRERAINVGLSTELIAQSISTAMRGENLREFRGEESEIKVRLAFRDSDKQGLDDLANLPLYNEAGERIRLGSVADFHITRGPRAIERRDRQTADVIVANLDDTSLEDIKPKIESLMEQFNMPPGYSWKFGRGFEDTDETQQMMVQNILLAIVLIFIVMAAVFESALYPLSIITSILFSIIGVFWFFLVTGTTFSFMAFIGIMILIGVVVNNGIVLIDHVNNLRREGMPRDAAILQSGKDRLRPILMTVATTILGLTPLAVGSTKIGGDGPPYFPMARAIIGGLAFSTVVSLLVVPSIYIWFDDLSKWGRKVVRIARGQFAAVPAGE